MITKSLCKFVLHFTVVIHGHAWLIPSRRASSHLSNVADVASARQSTEHVEDVSSLSAPRSCHPLAGSESPPGS